MDEDDGGTCLDMNESAVRLTDLELSAKIEEMIHAQASAVAAMEREARNNALRQIIEIKGAAYRQISRVTGVSVGSIQNASGDYINKVLKRNQ